MNQRPPAEAVEWVGRRHLHWCQTLHDATDGLLSQSLGRSQRVAWEHYCSIPAASIRVKASQVSGTYAGQTQECRYVLPYAVLESDYDQTIAHECCHHYQRVLWPNSQPHGDLFHWLLGAVCGIMRPNLTHHGYDPDRAKKMGELLCTDLSWLDRIEQTWRRERGEVIITLNQEQRYVTRN